jgi:4-diphosphocytidyl-2-C-methyl-D-erythritol kinase
MIVFPPCKINLGLYITRKREDVFHDLESIFYPINLCDALELIPLGEGKGEIKFSSTGIPIPGDVNSNLIVKAYHLLHEQFQLPSLHVHLHKVIPMGAGLGGGSSNGAWMLRALNQLFNLNLPIQTLLEYAAKLGSDCPFFIYDSPCKVSGRGEFLEPIDLDLSSYFIWLINPGIHISTAQAFSQVTPKSAPLNWEDQVNLSPDKWNFSNDFESGIAKQNSAIFDCLQILKDRGALYFAMTGTGSTVYGIFNHMPDITGIVTSYFSKVISGKLS